MLDFTSKNLFQNSHGFAYSAENNELLTGLLLSRKKFKEQLEKSIPQEENFIRISCLYSLEDLFYNFKFRTQNQEVFMCICPALGDSNDLWEFLEDICSPNFDNTAFLSMQEGPESILLAQKYNDEKIRFTIFNNRWQKHYWDFETKDYVFEWQNTDNGKMQIVLDIILNRKDFVYTFYLDLYDIFYGVDISSISYTYNKAQTDSDIIKNYLGYIPATEKDLELKNLFEEGNLTKIEEALQNGANPNAIVELEVETGNREQVLDGVLRCSYVDSHYPLDEIQNLTDEEYTNDIKKIKLLEHNLEIIKLLFKYGAKPTSLFPAVYSYYESEKVNIVKYLLDNGCVYDMETIRAVSSDKSFRDDFTPELQRIFNAFYNMFDEYLFDDTRHITL